MANTGVRKRLLMYGRGARYTACVALSCVVAAALVYVSGGQAHGATAALPAGFTDRLLAQVQNPTSMAVAPDGRLFVAQKASNNIGKLRVIKNGRLLTRPFLKLTTDTTYFRGLLGVTLDPNFSSNRHVYVFYTATSPTIHNRVSRFTANGNVAVAGSERPILDLPPLGNAGGHYGGALRFGADGKLYVGVGDDAAPANAQSLDSLNGKILRINADGTIPQDNPFFGGSSGDDAVWALGLRQPHSLDVLSGTGKMYVNEVGEGTWEEIDEVASGANYGWPTHEGPTPSPGPNLQNYKNPAWSYRHSGDPATTGCAITGGAFYDPATARFPARYQGDYFYADYCNGWIRAFDPTQGTDTGFATGIVKPVDLEVGENGSLYYLAKGSRSNPASVHEISSGG